MSNGTIVHQHPLPLIEKKTIKTRFFERRFLLPYEDHRANRQARIPFIKQNKKKPRLIREI